MLTEFNRRKEIITDSIRNRESIEAPPNYVSVYHETRGKFLDDIDHYGLQYDVEAKNFSVSGKITQLNRLLREARPDAIKETGLDRENVVFGYLDIQKGHGMGGFADEKFNDPKHQDAFKTLQEYTPDALTKTGVTTWEQWKDRSLEEIQSNENTAGAILELKVDPEKCYVGDLRIIEDQRYPGLTEETIKEGYRQYWRNVVSLKDLLQWYKYPNYTEEGRDEELEDPEEFVRSGGFLKKKGAPEHLPLKIDQPEVLIPHDIPQKFIKLIAS